MLEFLSKAESGVWMTDFQSHHINYASRDLACTINAGINYNNTTFIIEVEDEQQSDSGTGDGDARAK